MADNTPSSGSLIRPHRSPWGAFPTRHFPIVANSTFLAGRLVEQSTIASTASHRIADMSSLSTRIVGVVAESAGSSVVDTERPVWEANPFLEFRGFAKGTLASSNIGASYSFAYDSTLGIHYVDLANSSAADQRCQITELLNTAGDTNGEVVFKFRTEDGLATSTGRGFILAYFR